ncbi:MAG: ATP-binding protein [Deltaproteobacteria bacterium]|nr:ATP-binding protein [Deltaproteobacteria bacterium]
MVKRDFWLERINQALLRKNVVWFTGVRRSGKTTLCRQLGDVDYFDCELPRIQRLLDDPEEFFDSRHGRLIVLDEVHKIANPSAVLKIAADHYPRLKIVATGSSTLAATAKFSDTLTDRKRVVKLTPCNAADLSALGHGNLRERLLKGGLPPFLLSPAFDEAAYRDWIDGFWAKDIQEVFKIEKRYGFMKLMELLALQSGGLFEAQSLTAPCELSRQTVMNYLGALEIAHAAVILRPFSSNPAREIVAAPKVYFFDTGFINYFHGRTSLTESDCGPLWEHFVLNEMLSLVPPEKIHFWRDKAAHEVDFVVQGMAGARPIAIECKWKSRQFSENSVSVFRDMYPQSPVIVVASDENGARKKTARRMRDLYYTGLEGLPALLKSFPN